MLKAMKGCGKLADTVAFMQTLLEPSAYVCIGKGIDLVTAPFKMEEGVQQGTVESDWLLAKCRISLATILHLIQCLPPDDVAWAKMIVWLSRFRI